MVPAIYQREKHQGISESLCKAEHACLSDSQCEIDYQTISESQCRGHDKRLSQSQHLSEHQRLPLVQGPTVRQIGLLSFFGLLKSLGRLMVLVPLRLLVSLRSLERFKSLGIKGLMLLAVSCLTSTQAFSANSTAAPSCGAALRETSTLRETSAQEGADALAAELRPYAMIIRDMTKLQLLAIGYLENGRPNPNYDGRRINPAPALLHGKIKEMRLKFGESLTNQILDKVNRNISALISQDGGASTLPVRGDETTVAPKPTVFVEVGPTFNEVRTLSEQTEMKKHTDWITSLLYIPGPDPKDPRKGSQIVTGSADKTAMIWDVDTGQVVRTLSGHTGGITSLLYIPGPDPKNPRKGSQIVTGDYDAKIWDASVEPVEVTAD